MEKENTNFLPEEETPQPIQPKRGRSRKIAPANGTDRPTRGRAKRIIPEEDEIPAIEDDAPLEFDGRDDEDSASINEVPTGAEEQEPSASIDEEVAPTTEPAPSENTSNSPIGAESFSGRGERWEKRTTEKFNVGARGERQPSPTFMGGVARQGNFPPVRDRNINPQPKAPSQRFQQKQKTKFQSGKFSPQGKFERNRGGQESGRGASWGAFADNDTSVVSTLEIGNSFDYNKLKDEEYLAELEKIARHTVKKVKVATPQDEMSPALDDDLSRREASLEQSAGLEKTELQPCEPGEILDFNEIYKMPLPEVIELAEQFGIPVLRNPQRRPLIRKIMDVAFEAGRPIAISGTLEPLASGNGLLLYPEDNFSVRELSAYVPKALIDKYGLQRGHELSTIVHPPMPGETAPIVVAVTSIMGTSPDEIKNLTPFTELTPYYPTERIMLETSPEFPNNLSMRCVDLLCPIGLGQRGLIVAPPRVGKTVLLQTIANAILKNKPKAKLIVLLVDERPEEVTDFKRNTAGAEIISSTFDESPENHVHVAEMVIERARRMVELGMDVVILLDSITRLARAYNTLMPNGGKILSGGVEAGALAKPKRFFGSARNIEDGGSLTILGTALIDTGSKMDEVIFEEFKGTGNMELDLDRDLANKRIYPAINFERSGTRKEELLYHPDEMQHVHSMRRAMKGIPSIEAMEMLITRMKKTKTNIEFLMTLATGR